jgi:tRNA (cytidine/uridine-2'-O-)-methyltransferase
METALRTPARMSHTDESSGASELTADRRPLFTPGLNVVLVEPEIAMNTGAIGRTCVAAGAMLWLVRPLGFHIDDRHLRRAGLDYWEHLSWRIVDSLDEVVAALGPDRLWSFSARASRSYTTASFLPGDSLVFGPESRGLPRHWLDQHPEHALRIPIRAEARSLNLGSAVAVAVFEALRQVSGTQERQIPQPLPRLISASSHESSGGAPEIGPEQ